jgi:hypothetical protein
MLKTLPVRRWQSRQWHIEIFDGSPSHLKAMEPQWHCVVRDVISFYSEEACIHGTERIATPLCWWPNGMSNILPKNAPAVDMWCTFKTFDHLVAYAEKDGVALSKAILRILEEHLPKGKR